MVRLIRSKVRKCPVLWRTGPAQRPETWGNLLNWDTPQRIDSAELIDDPSQPYADLKASMADVQRVNRFLGGAAAVSGQAMMWLRSAATDEEFAGRPVTFLDVATG